VQGVRAEGASGVGENSLPPRKEETFLETKQARVTAVLQHCHSLHTSFQGLSQTAGKDYGTDSQQPKTSPEK
jgi:hypothetical protein